MTTPTSPIRIAIVNDYDIVVAGVAAALAPYGERVKVIELDSGLPVLSDVDVILYDTFGQVQGDAVDLEDLVHGGEARVIVFSWNTQPDLVRRTIEKGASGYVSKASTAEQIVDAIESVHSGTVVTPPADVSPDVASGAWPGQDHGLSAREGEIVALITQGLSNQEIADMTYLSINSVKTYIRTAYRKLGVSRRSQAVIWGVTHGFEPDRGRTVDRRVEGG